MHVIYTKRDAREFEGEEGAVLPMKRRIEEFKRKEGTAIIGKRVSKSLKKKMQKFIRRLENFEFNGEENEAIHTKMRKFESSS